MRKFLVLLLVLFVSFSLLAGCSDDAEESVKPVDIKDFPAEHARLTCERA